MRVDKALITAASPRQRTLPMQNLVAQDGQTKSVLAILVEEAVQAGVSEICVVVGKGDEEPYRKVAGEHASRVTFIAQPEARGYGHALWCAREFVGGEAFLHLVGDHVYVAGANGGRPARQVVDAALQRECAVSAVQMTRESLLPWYGAVGGTRVSGTGNLYRIETVIEKPTPTEAEQRLIVPGLRAGQYLCFFGIHVLTPAVMSILAELLETATAPQKVTLSDALTVLATREQYLALEIDAMRYDLGAKYGLTMAQLALALHGEDRGEVLSGLVQLLAAREMAAAAR
jgi:UTP--glucose-1-phosphate uridylyltransferase